MRHHSVAMALNLVLLLASLVAVYDSIAITTERSPGFRMYLLMRSGALTINEEKVREVNRRFTGPVDWQFTTEDARIKLKQLYPSIQV